MSSEAEEPTHSRWRAWLRPLLGLALFGVALTVLDRQLHEHTIAEVQARLRAIPNRSLLLALALTVLSYVTLTSFDVLAIRHLGKKLPYARVGLTSFIAYVFSIDLGLSVFGSSAIRYRLYSMWGLSIGDVGSVVAFTLLTFWLGLLALGGLLLSLDPLTIPDALHIPVVSLTTTRPVGLFLLALFVLYLVYTMRRPDPIHVQGVAIRPPRPAMTAAQVIAASVDWAVAASVLWVLLPEGSGPTFATFVAIFMAAEVLGVLSTVPAGLGVFEGVMLALLSPYWPAPEILGGLVAFRIVYYLLPIFVAVGLLGAIEALQRRASLLRVRAMAAVVGPAVVPRLLALAVLVSGLLLILAGMAPTAAWHVKMMRPVIALPLVEASHLMSVISGLGLVLLARGIQRRVDATWSVTLALLAVGATTSLLHGAHWLLGIALVVLFLSLLGCRPFFYRRSSLLPSAMPGEFTGLVVVSLAAMVWLGTFAYAHAEPEPSLLYEFAWDRDAARALRAASLIALLGIAYGAWRLTRPHAPDPVLASEAELERAARIVATSSRSDAHLALLGDKCLLFDEDEDDALLMYGVSGRSFVAMGDPLGPTGGRRALAWRFRELADQHGGWPVFYEVGTEDLPTYLDLGLSLHKLGEDARVELQSFSLEGSHRKSARAALRRMERAGGSFEVIPKEGVPPLLDELEEISDAWLRAKRTREKGFSLGAFDRSYLTRTPVAIVRANDRIVAFANVWMGDRDGEISPDLMRYDPDTAPHSAMDYLFTELMLYGKEEGFRWFGLGMAPLSGLEQHRLAPIWNRLGSLLYQHGEHFYNFQGLRQYKAKFDPVWEARYLASPGGLSLPRVLADVSSLVSGGMRGIVSR